MFRFSEPFSLESVIHFDSYSSRHPIKSLLGRYNKHTSESVRQFKTTLVSAFSKMVSFISRKLRISFLSCETGIISVKTTFRTGWRSKWINRRFRRNLNDNEFLMTSYLCKSEEQKGKKLPLQRRKSGKRSRGTVLYRFRKE